MKAFFGLLETEGVRDNCMKAAEEDCDLRPSIALERNLDGFSMSFQTSWFCFSVDFWQFLGLTIWHLLGNRLLCSVIFFHIFSRLLVAANPVDMVLLLKHHQRQPLALRELQLQGGL